MDAKQNFRRRRMHRGTNLCTRNLVLLALSHDSALNVTQVSAYTKARTNVLRSKNTYVERKLKKAIESHFRAVGIGLQPEIIFPNDKFLAVLKGDGL